MSEDGADRPSADERARRLGEALRANLRRRKTQARERSRAAKGEAESHATAKGDDSQEGCS
jgi:hypothetical protein